ncbi:MAG: VCBS repeat-containing protein [Acidobacteria bacterium]|nr:VCBS repeat-containing protein [Acidobacteriota bacterium]
MRHAALLLILVGLAIFLVRFPAPKAQEIPVEEQLWIHRNLGKAFYENPTTHAQAVDEFQKALALAPNSARERLNYGLALLRNGKTAEGIAELVKVQQQDPSIPHTWFNLGIAFKKESEYGRALQQFEQMVKLVTNDAVSYYNLGYLYKLEGNVDQSLQAFETAAKLDPNLAGPHFQLYNAYRAAGRAADADRELQIFQEIKKLQAGAVIPEDLDWSAYAEIYDPIEPSPVPDREITVNELKFDEQQIAANFDVKNAGLALLDYDGDRRPDVIVWSATGVRIFKNGSVLVQDAGLNDLKEVLSVAPGDFNNDGWPDLAVLTESGASLYANQNGVFQKSSVSLPGGTFAQPIWLDFDHDYDLDLFLLGQNSILMRNNGNGGFSDETATFPFVKRRASGGVVTDLDALGNGMDLVVAYQDGSGVVYRDHLLGKYEAEPLEALPPATQSLLARDLNNDGWTDLVASKSSGISLLINNGKGKLEGAAFPASAKGPPALADFENRGLIEVMAGELVFRNQGLGRFQEGKAVTSGVPAVAMVASDFDGDGQTDLMAINSDGTVRRLKNQTNTRNSWVEIGLEGIKNLKLAPGARVEVKAGSLYQKQTYNGTPLTFGLQAHVEVDTVRITWPNGLVQNEMKQTVGKSLTYKEAQRLSGSCPMIFTWDGKKFDFITDVLGVAPLGASSGDGQYFPVDHDEYIQIPGSVLALENGHYEIRITEELREVSYIDAIRLIAVDHPADVAIFTNEKFKAPPFPEFRLFGVRRRIYPIAANDDRGSNVLPQLLQRDHRYPDGFQRDYAGVAELHHLDLDFGSAAPQNRAVLVLSGWLDWADGSTYRAVSQERKEGLVMPYLQVKDAQGRWQTVIEDMGIPAGKPKTIVVDLTDKFLSASREIRIVTDLCLYWDEIFLGEETAPPPVVLTDLELAVADLRFRGFSKPIIHPQRKQPESFLYADWMPFSMWNPTPGNYTRYGGVNPLLASVDDHLVIMGSGDEMQLRFSAMSLPPLPRGWQRDFLLLVDGWAKDQDANTAFAQSVEPLPFHGMSAYPYPATEHFPDDDAHQLYREQYNTRPALRLLHPLPELLSKVR